MAVSPSHFMNMLGILLSLAKSSNAIQVVSKTHTAASSVGSVDVPGYELVKDGEYYFKEDTSGSGFGQMPQLVHVHNWMDECTALCDGIGPDCWGFVVTKLTDTATVCGEYKVADVPESLPTVNSTVLAQVYKKQLLVSASRSDSLGTCTIYEDPHVEVFDGAQVSLLAEEQAFGISNVVDQWLVKSPSVRIQARYNSEDDGSPDIDKNVFAKSVAVGGPFLNGNTLIIAPLEEQSTWNGMPILEDQSSASFYISDEVFVKDRSSHNSSHVRDLSTKKSGVNIQLPMNVSLIANRSHYHVSLAITMPPQMGGQDGLCGNFNGVIADDAPEMLSERLTLKVPPGESLFPNSVFS